jgi:kynurenine 3-monooxygenase
MSHSETIGVIGGGLVGCLAGLAFAKKGFKVKVFEARPDMRTPDEQALSQLRSINLAVSSRGIRALRSVDSEMANRVLKDLVPMHGRMIHDLNGNQTCQKYGLHGESINSINRALINRSLLDELDQLDNVELLFNQRFFKCEGLATESPRGFFSVQGTSDLKLVDDVDVWIGADGAYSGMRHQIIKTIPMNFSQEYIDHYYLELRIPRGGDTEETKFSLNPNHLHIWPRHDYMLIALANADGSFTCTLFAPRELFDEQLVTDDAIVKFFKLQFPDALDLMGRERLLESFANNPRGSLVCVRCSPYNAGGNAIIIGDAAHSMVPFYGQGMNAGFEDVRTLMEILDKHQFNFASAFDEYSNTRHKDVTAIVDLSMNNYIEMRHDVVSPAYLIRKQIDGMLYKLLGDRWLPLYTMVSFRDDISYARAVERRAFQDRLLTNVLRGLGIGAAILAVFCKPRFFFKVSVHGFGLCRR